MQAGVGSKAKMAIATDGAIANTCGLDAATGPEHAFFCMEWL